MAEFTKEQMINLARENVRVLKQAAMQHKVQPVIAMDFRLAEIALAALTAGMGQEPVAYMVGDYSLLHHQDPIVDEYLDRATPLYAAPQLPKPAMSVDFLPNNLDRALGVMGMALPESREEFNLQQERWTQRLIDRVIRCADELGPQPAVVIPLGVTWEDVPEEITEDDMGLASAWAHGFNQCRAAMLQGNHRDLSQPVDPQVAAYGKIMQQALPANSFTNAELEGMAHGDNPQANAYLELLAYRLSSGGWIPCSERMPDADGNYWGWWSESKRQGPVWFIKSELQSQFQSSEITHWMELPAAPQQEVK